MIQAGLLRNRVTFQRRTLTPDGQGGEVQTWTDLTQEWASLVPINSQHRFWGGLEGERATHRMQLRWMTNVTLSTTDRGILGSRTFIIVSAINVDELDRELILLVRETK